MAAVEERVAQQVDVEALEAMWAAPDTAQLAYARRRRLERVGQTITLAWIAAIVAAMIFEPAPTEPAPWWAETVNVVVALGWMAAFAVTFLESAAAAAKVFTALAPVAFVLGATCGMDSHHAAGWWISETAIAGGLGLAGAAWWRASSRAQAPHHAG